MPQCQEKDEKRIYMTNAPIPKIVIQLALPCIMTTLISSIYSMADTYFVGTLGKSASGAIGIVFSLMSILQAFGYLFGQGCGSTLSRMLGQGDIKGASRFGSTGFFLALGVGVIIGALGLCFLTPFMYLLGSTKTILPYAQQYSRYILLAGPFFSASCVLNAVLRYEGRSLLAMVGLVSGGLLNIVLDPIFIFSFNMGVGGAGLATALSQCVSFCILLYMFLSGKTAVRLRLKYFTKDWKEILQILYVGLPSLLRQGLGSLSGMMLNQQARLFGDAAVAAMSVVNRISNFIFSINLGIGQGFQPVVAYNYGAKKFDRVKRSFWFASIFSITLLLTICTVCFIYAEPLVRFFQKDPSVVPISMPAFRLQCVANLLLPLTSCGNMMFQCAGRPGQASLVAALRSGLCFIPLILIFPHYLGISGIYISQPVSDAIAFAITLPISLSFLRQLPKDSK